ncbi:MAG: hypothetical protein JSS51_09660 [Planctomycetes bacterium]|nr:hypothetical protein [Planctomycetota bacterium]
MRLVSPGDAPRRSRFSPVRATAYRVLNEERRASGLRALTIEELNRRRLWQIMQETSALINARKGDADLFGA